MSSAARESLEESCFHWQLESHMERSLQGEHNITLIQEYYFLGHRNLNLVQEFSSLDYLISFWSTDLPLGFPNMSLIYRSSSWLPNMILILRYSSSLSQHHSELPIYLLAT
ncbi:hypothetical protein RRG08_006813 [Elysia crispata]|uniref:Uncharacterized protein n=1 Tax=Elysia crispata TaxID=231223 RepID=A0AAE1E7Z1_9GAST|nr:hypothetical protein RRG08_006813 [Elysia crispata]